MPWFKLESEEGVNLEKTLFSGQTFSFKKTGADEYTGAFKGSIITFKQEGDVVYYMFNREMQEDLSLFFTLDINYQKLIDGWNAAQNYFKFRYTGLRLLRCELVETIFSFICSSNNNVARITKMVEYLLQKGRFVGEVNNCTFYEFPRTEALMSIEEELRRMKFGFRAPYICSAAQRLQSIELGGCKSYVEANKMLMSIDGIGQKIADCICLMSLGHFDVVPIDTHVFNMSKKMFGLSQKLNKNTCTYIKQKYRESFGEYAGIAQLFIFKESLDHRQGRKSRKGMASSSKIDV